MAGTVKHARLESQALATGSNAAVSLTGRRSSRARCISAASAGRATPEGAGCCGVTSATANTGCRPWACPTTPPSADGADVLSFEQAAAKARAMVASPNGDGNGTIVHLTVRQAMPATSTTSGRRANRSATSSAAAACTSSPRSATSWSANCRRAVAPLAGHHGRRPGAAPRQGQQAAVPARANHRRGTFASAAPVPIGC